MPHHIAILGGSGFVGRHLTARLLKEGHQLAILSRRPRPSDCADDLQWLQIADFTQSSLEEALQSFDVVINLIGILNESGHDGREFYALHEDLPRTLTAACLAQGVGRLLHMSALGASADALSHYQRSKAAGNQAIEALAGEKLAWTLIQPSVIFGPDDSLFMRFAALLKWLPVFPLACPQARFAPVWVGDVVELFVRCLQDDSSHGRRVEVCGPQILTLKQIVEYAAKHSGRRRWVIPLGNKLSLLQAHVMEYLPGKPFSLDNYRSAQRDNVCDPSSTALNLSKMGIEPTPLDQVMPQALAQQ
ncbi:MAG: complex I NDUFA9 subunit family protein [Salinisphaeraceae bacterium]|nr:complex I NDUFA9 subunit family protein [Salinisphaeraceae bacterium]